MCSTSNSILTTRFSRCYQWGKNYAKQIQSPPSMCLIIAMVSSSQTRLRHNNPPFKQSPGLFEAPALTSSCSRASRTPPLPQATVDGVHPCHPNRGRPFATLLGSDRNVPSPGILPRAGVAGHGGGTHRHPARTVSPSTCGRRRNRIVSGFRSWCGSTAADSLSVQELRPDPAPRCWRVVERWW